MLFRATVTSPSYLYYSDIFETYLSFVWSFNNWQVRYWHFPESGILRGHVENKTRVVVLCSTGCSERPVHMTVVYGSLTDFLKRPQCLISVYDVCMCRNCSRIDSAIQLSSSSVLMYGCIYLQYRQLPWNKLFLYILLPLFFPSHFLAGPQASAVRTDPIWEGLTLVI